MKKKLRIHIRQTLERMSPSLRRQKSALAQQALVALPEFQAAGSVMIYLPMKEEVDTSIIAQHAWQTHKHVLAPCVHLPDHTMQVFPIHSMLQGLVPGPYDILEPRDGEPWPAERIDFIVVPGLGFNRRGGRLGRGAGFYDRFMAQVGWKATAVFCGLAFAEQVVDDIPMFDHDEPVDIVVTDKEVLDFRNARDQ